MLWVYAIFWCIYWIEVWFSLFFPFFNNFFRDDSFAILFYLFFLSYLDILLSFIPEISDPNIELALKPLWNMLSCPFNWEILSSKFEKGFYLKSIKFLYCSKTYSGYWQYIFFLLEPILGNPITVIKGELNYFPRLKDPFLLSSTTKNVVLS